MQASFVVHLSSTTVQLLSGFKDGSKLQPSEVSVYLFFLLLVLTKMVDGMLLLLYD